VFFASLLQFVIACTNRGPLLRNTSNRIAIFFSILLHGQYAISAYDADAGPDWFDTYHLESHLNYVQQKINRALTF
jgi:hypothetical protein